jgi:DNA-directed RNA polymerase specialized sigma24 family protein
MTETEGSQHDPIMAAIVERAHRKDNGNGASRNERMGAVSAWDIFVQRNEEHLTSQLIKDAIAARLSNSSITQTRVEAFLFEGLSPAEIAEREDNKRTTVQTSISRGLDSIMSYLRHHIGENTPAEISDLSGLSIYL